MKEIIEALKKVQTSLVKEMRSNKTDSGFSDEFQYAKCEMALKVVSMLIEAFREEL